MANFFQDTPNFTVYVNEQSRQRVEGGFSSGLEFIKPETQKARGIVLLHGKEKSVYSHLLWRTPKHLPFPSGTQFSNSSFNYPVFGRPCPTVPRHGFVDSVVCKNAEELNALSSETLKVEEGSEILVTKPVDCSFNAIATGGVVTIGGGNDGATSGKGVRYFYLAEDPIGKAIDIENHQDVLLEGEVPFYEIVISKKGIVSLVQVRSAPGMPLSKNFIPKKMKVKNIIKAEGDLIEWETKVKSIDGETTIIDHSGGSLASHFSIHAIINGITIFTQDCPSIGDEIEPNADGTEITKEEREKFTRAFKIGFASTPEMIKRHHFFGRKMSLDSNSKSYEFMKDVLRTSLATLHNYSAIHKHRDYAMLGSILGMFTRTCIGVSSGETRFKRGLAGKISASKPDVSDWLYKCDDDRNSVYTKLMQSSTEEVVNNIIPIYKCFKELSWSGGYGGKAWVNCTEAAINLYNDCLSGNIEGAVEKFNVVIHTSHNGGLYLNKIQEDGEMFDEASYSASRFALRRLHYIAGILDNFAQVEADSSIWEGGVEFLKPIDLAETKDEAEKGSPVPATIDGKTAIKIASEIHVKVCKSCPSSHGLQVLVNGQWYKASKSPSYHSGEAQAGMNKSFGWVKLDKIPYWLGTYEVPKLFSIQAINKLTFNKI